MAIRDSGELEGNTTIEELIKYIEELQYHGNNNGINVTVKKGEKTCYVSRVLVGPDFGSIGIAVELEEEE